MRTKDRGRTRDAPALIPATLVVTALFVLGCERSAPATPSQQEARSPAPADDAGLLRLSPEAIRLARIETIVLHPAPFTVSLSVPCRLSPTAETSEELEARLAYQAAQARHERAAVELARLKTLLGQEVVAPKSVQAAQAEAAAAAVDLRRAETALHTLGIENASKEISARADIWALAEIYEAQASDLKPGSSAWVRVEARPTERFPARLVSLARFVKPQSGTLTARLAVHDDRRVLRPQGLGTAEIAVGERTTLAVPVTALLYRETDRVVFLRTGDGFTMRTVRVGASDAVQTEIVEGLADGAVVVTRGTEHLMGEWLRARHLAGAAEEDDEDRVSPGEP